MSDESATPSGGFLPTAIPRLSGFQPRTGTLDQWNAAYMRVEDYLRAHRIHNRLHQSRVIERVLECAAHRHEANPGLDPVMLAAEEMDRLMQTWFASQLGEGALSAERRAAQARVAMLLSDLPTRWPYTFLDQENTPSEARVAMEKSALQAGPDLAVSNMVPREIDLGTLPEAAGDTLERLERWPIIRLLLLWAVFAAVMAALFFKTR
ncbi:MAG TPA: hypothetical protein VK178_12510 [Opitutaceae bacterium]|nr:hypothetical protein [Opitutaceae bacterium]